MNYYVKLYHELIFMYRQNSNRVDGWIEVKMGASSHSNVWQNRWFIFDDGVLKYSKDPKSAEDEYVKIPMNSVITLKADVRNIRMTVDYYYILIYANIYL